jgi:hypothetical protein
LIERSARARHWLRWWRAKHTSGAARYFRAPDATLARQIAKAALCLRSDIGLCVEEIDADEQPELIETGHSAGDSSKTWQTPIFIARGF